MTSIVVITAGMSQPSSSRLLADRLAGATRSALSVRSEDVTAHTVELREYARDLANHIVTGFPGPRLAEVMERVGTADGLIVVSPIFSSSYSGLFKLFFDVLEPGLLDGTPVLIGATAGTARHSLALEYALRPLFAYLRATVAPTAVFVATDDWGNDHELAHRIDRAGAELAALVLAAGSSARIPVAGVGSSPAAPSRRDDTDRVIPFSQLLAAHTGTARGR